MITDNKSFLSFVQEHRLKVVLFFLFSACVLTVSLTFFSLSLDKPYMGVVLEMDDQSWAVKDTEAIGIAIQVGIKEGDIPVEINGQPAEEFLQKYEKQGSVVGLLVKKITVKDSSGQLKYASVEDKYQSWPFLMETISFLVFCFVFWIVGFFTFFRRPNSPAALLLCLCSLAFGLTLSGNAAGERSIPFAIPLAVAGALYGPWLLFHFFIILPDERAWLSNKPLIYLIYVPATISFLLFFLIGYSEGQPVPWFRIARLLVYGIGFCAAVGIAVFNYFHAISPRTKQQMKVVLISCILALTPILLIYILPETILGQRVLPGWVTILFVGIIPIGLGYAVVKRQLLDIDIIIRRGVIYALVTLVMALILSIAIFTAIKLQNTLGIIEQVLLAIALGGIATFLFGPLKKGIELIIDKIFYKDRYDYRQTIEILSNSLKSLNELSDISRIVVGTLTNTLNITGTCLFISAEDSFEVGAAQGRFTANNYQNRLKTLISKIDQQLLFPNTASNLDPNLAYLVPLTFENKEIGFICLSHKASMQKYCSDDIFLIQGVASIATIALHSAILIHDVSIKNTFISIASHELRTPLTAIMGYTELLLRKESQDDVKKKWLKNILNNGQQITAMANDLLNVNRIQSGKVIFRMKQLNLSNFLSEQINLMREYSEKHEFVLNIDPTLPNVLVDSDKLSQVINNLLINAVKYSPNGGRITVSAHQHIQDNCVVLSIRDEGIGISPEDMRALFTTFHRIQRPETQGIRGSGLGLYIAKEWTESMGGRIRVESELNKGSTFYVEIPVPKANDTNQ